MGTAVPGGTGSPPGVEAEDGLGGEAFLLEVGGVVADLDQGLQGLHAGVEDLEFGDLTREAVEGGEGLCRGLGGVEQVGCGEVECRGGVAEGVARVHESVEHAGD